MGKCQDCRWWKPIRGEPGMGLCSTLGGYPIGGRIEIYISSAPTAPSVPIATGELFGCFKFEAREV